MAETKEKPAPKTIYVNDPDAKKFYEMRDHDAMCLQEGDLTYSGDRLCQVTTVSRRKGGWTVRLDNGVEFDPRPNIKDGVDSNEALRRITFWRPRKGF